jgi:molecular chaperone DnaK (HSP70)
VDEDIPLTASSGQQFSALAVFAHVLNYLRDHALAELSDQSGIAIQDKDVRWVITVPANWKSPSQQFIRHAAYEVRKKYRN